MNDIDRDRRGLLQALAALPWWPVLGGGAASAGFLVSVRHSAAQLGQAYLADHPDEADVERLEHLLAGLGDDPEELARAASEDFARGRLVRVRRCWLAVSEARACALVALQS